MNNLSDEEMIKLIKKYNDGEQGSIIPIELCRYCFLKSRFKYYRYHHCSKYYDIIDDDIVKRNKCNNIIACKYFRYDGKHPYLFMKPLRGLNIIHDEDLYVETKQKSLAHKEFNDLAQEVVKMIKSEDENFY